MKISYILKAFSAEWLKVKGLGLVYLTLVSGIIMPLIMFLLQIFVKESRTYDGMIQSAGQHALQSEFTTFADFFLLVAIIISAVRVAQTDHKNSGWTFLETQPISKFAIYTGKFLVIGVLSLLCITTFMFSGWLLGTLSNMLYPQENLVNTFEAKPFFHNYIRLCILALGVMSLQVMLSVVIRGFIWPFLVGFLGIIINVVATLREETYDFIPYNNVDTSASFSNPEKLNHFFNYSDWLSVYWMVLFFLVGYLVYSHRGFKNAFFKNNKIFMRTLAGTAVAVGLYFFLTKPIYPEKLKGKTVVEGSIISTEQPKFVTIISKELNSEVVKIPVQNGKFRWETSKEVPFAEYVLSMDKRYAPLLISTGDHIILKINSDKKHFETTQNGTRKAEAQFLVEEGDNSYFYNVILREKQYANEPQKFYEAAQEQWKEDQYFIDHYRTKENIHFSEDFYQYKKQNSAVKMLGAIADYRKMTSLSDAKFAPPKSFISELSNIVKQPTNLLLASENYNKWKLKTLAENGGLKSDSLIFSKINALPKGKERDQLLKTQMLKVFDLMKEEQPRNEVFAKYGPLFSDARYADYVADQLKILNAQQKGKPFPAMAFEDASGKRMSLSQFKGKYVVIDLWATWCVPCLEAKPVFDYLAKNHQRYGNIVFLSASVDEDKNKWKLGIKNEESHSQQWWIANKDALSILGVKGIPRFIMLDPNGNIYNANMPHPGETNFQDILDGVKNPDGVYFNF